MMGWIVKYVKLRGMNVNLSLSERQCIFACNYSSTTTSHSKIQTLYNMSLISKADFRLKGTLHSLKLSYPGNLR